MTKKELLELNDEYEEELRSIRDKIDELLGVEDFEDEDDVEDDDSEQ